MNETQAVQHNTEASQRRRNHHDLKLWPASFEKVRNGTLRHQTRTTVDRQFYEGDTITLKEFEPPEGDQLGTYTGREWNGTIGAVTPGGQFGLPHDLCTFSIFERY